MTEDEAKTKWCPFSRVGYPGGDMSSASPNRTVIGTDTLNGANFCIASACMAWRWDEAKRTAAFLEAVQAHMQTQKPPNFNMATQVVYAEKGGQFERVEGYCGLAGQS